MPGFEYRFITLGVKMPNEAAVDSIDGTTLEREQLETLGKTGWRIRSMCAHPGNSRHVFVAFERELRPEKDA